MSRQCSRETLPRSANSAPAVDAADRRRNVGIVEWTAWFDAPEYEFARQVLQRGIAAIYLVAFLSSLNQFPALLGERGLLPVPDFLARSSRLRRPTLFSWRYSDRLLRAVCWGGMAIAATLVLGLPQLGPPWVPMLAFLALWLLYMSIVNVGQTFYGFGWEMLLLEAGLHCGLPRLRPDSPAADHPDPAGLAGVPPRVWRGHDQDPRRPGVA